jgi:hypothetical protein
MLEAVSISETSVKFYQSTTTQTTSKEFVVKLELQVGA